MTPLSTAPRDSEQAGLEDQVCGQPLPGGALKGQDRLRRRFALDDVAV